uniref:SPX domain-containing protein n=1 Tax=Macrostomum lignano TaxID=282301 RepID=A0A1I8J668_9PLAT
SEICLRLQQFFRQEKNSNSLLKQNLLHISLKTSQETKKATRCPSKEPAKLRRLVLLLLLSLQLAQAAPSRPRDAAYRYAPSEADLAVPNGSYHPAEQANFNVAEWKRSGSNDFNAARLLAKLADFKAKNDFLTQRIRMG